ncbi:MAG: bifunctional precorrin-2 dehydrogenase/sirohydrochlorin ferrochelatase [Candidatus Aenigmatarchaeota archaeon]
MRYYPINLNIKGKKCLVIGGGGVAERKVEVLLKCGALVTVISPTITERIRELVEDGKIEYICRSYRRGDLNGYFLAISATDSSEVNDQVWKEAEEIGLLLNVVDNPEKCHFTVPSVIQRGDLLITISTSGKSPALSRKLREDLERIIGDEYGIFLDILGSIRKRISVVAGSPEERKGVFDELVNSPIIQWIKEKRFDEIDVFLRNRLGEDFSLDRLGIRN